MSCKKAAPDSTANSTVAVPSSFPKNILIEEFAGVHAANIPYADNQISSILTSNSGNVVAITMYSYLDGSLTDSFIGSKSSYRTKDADIIRNMLGGAGSLPEIAVDRKLFQNQSKISFDRNYLQTNFNNELNQVSIAGVDFISKSFNPATGSLKVTVRVEYGAAMKDSDYLSLAIKESNLIDLQDASGSIDSFYVHRNVLRRYALTSDKTSFVNPGPGRIYNVNYNIAIPNDWNYKNLSLVAILHKQNAAKNDYSVSQVKETFVY